MSTRQMNIKRLKSFTIFINLVKQISILLIIVFITIPFAQADNLTVRVGVYENAPKIFTSKSGKPAGIFIDIIEHIAKVEDWKLRYVSGSWAEGLERLGANLGTPYCFLF
ncbi:MAG: transporter substrate-binding domain-containing protein [Syntrophaceae bacterium]|nr:transporter substrate-binding domain-containing protein [Syntrophaceae bacterium]